MDGLRTHFGTGRRPIADHPRQALAALQHVFWRQCGGADQALNWRDATTRQIQAGILEVNQSREDATSSDALPTVPPSKGVIIMARGDDLVRPNAVCAVCIGPIKAGQLAALLGCGHALIRAA